MNSTEILFEISEALNGPGEPFDAGCQSTDVPSIILAAREISGKPYCVVSNWQIWNIPYAESALEVLRKEGLKPSVLYAKNVMFDELFRWSPGSQVRTTLQTDLHLNCIYETRNTLYILMGQGIQKTVPENVITKITF